MGHPLIVICCAIMEITYARVKLDDLPQLVFINKDVLIGSLFDAGSDWRF